MLKNKSIIHLKEYRQLFQYFNEVLNGTPNPTDITHCLIENLNQEIFTVQLKRKYRSNDIHFKPTRLRVNRAVLEEKPEIVRCKVGIRTDKNGKQFHCVELSMPHEYETENNFELHTLKLEPSKKNEAVTVFLAGGCERTGKPAATLFNLMLNI